MFHKFTKIIDYGATISKFNKAVANYNQTAKLGAKIRPQHKQLYQVLISLYGIELNTILLVVSSENTHILPPLRINTKGIAKLQQTCAKTTYNHLLRLDSAGFIQKKYKGSNTDLEIRFNSEFLEIEPSISISGKWQSLQHINIKNKNINNNTSTKGVEKLSEVAQTKGVPVNKNVEWQLNSISKDNISTNSLRLEQTNKNTSNTARNQTETNSLATPQALAIQETKQEQKFPPAAENTQSIVNQSNKKIKEICEMADLLWIHAANTIYAEMPLTAGEILKGKRLLGLLLTTGIANTGNKTTEIYNLLNGAIATQYDYFKRKKRDNKQVKIFIPSINFHLENSQGLIGAVGWYLQNLEMKKIFKDKQIKELLVKKMIMKFTNNYKKDTGKKECSDADMFVKCKNSIMRSNYKEQDKIEMLSTFASCFLNQQNPNINFQNIV